MKLFDFIDCTKYSELLYNNCLRANTLHIINRVILFGAIIFVFIIFGVFLYKKFSKSQQSEVKKHE